MSGPNGRALVPPVAVYPQFATHFPSGNAVVRPAIGTTDLVASVSRIANVERKRTRTRCERFDIVRNTEKERKKGEKEIRNFLPFFLLSLVKTKAHPFSFICLRPVIFPLSSGPF